MKKNQRLHLNACAGIPEEAGKEIEWLDYRHSPYAAARPDASRIVCENHSDDTRSPDRTGELLRDQGLCLPSLLSADG